MVLTFHKPTFHEEGYRPPNSPLYASPRITKDIVKVPYKESKKEGEGTGPQDLNYSRFFLVGDSSRSFGPDEKIRFAQKRRHHERCEYTLMIHGISI
jgi:hypothetical protein